MLDSHLDLSLCTKLKKNEFRGEIRHVYLNKYVTQVKVVWTHLRVTSHQRWWLSYFSISRFKCDGTCNEVETRFSRPIEVARKDATLKRIWQLCGIPPCRNAGVVGILIKGLQYSARKVACDIAICAMVVTIVRTKNGRETWFYCRVSFCADSGSREWDFN